MNVTYIVNACLLGLMTIKSKQDFIYALQYAIHFVLWMMLHLFEKVYVPLLWITLKHNKTAYKDFAVRKKIIGRKRLTNDAKKQADSEFLCVGHELVPANYILRDNVSVYGIEGDKILFVETPESMDLYDVNKHPFIYETQVNHSTHLLVVSMDTAHKMAEDLGDPKQKVIYLSFIARSGSTLLAKVFHNTGVVHTLSLYCPCRGLYSTHKHLSDSDRGKILSTMLRIMCKPLKNKCDVSGNMITTLVRPISFDIVLLPLLQKYVPWLKHIAMYRGGLKAVQSLQSFMFHGPNKVTMKIPFTRHLYMTCSRYNQVKRGPNPDYADCLFLLACWQYASQMSWMVDYQKKYKIPCYQMEELVENPCGVIRSIFEECGVPVSLVEEGAAALREHSHANSLFATQRRMPITQYVGTVKQKADRLCKELGVPTLEENISFQNDL